MRDPPDAGRVTEHGCRSARGTNEAQQQAQGGRLAGTIRPEEAIYPTAPHLGSDRAIDGDPFPAEHLAEDMGLDPRCLLGLWQSHR